MAEPNLDRVLRATPKAVRSSVAKERYDICVNNAAWVKFDNDPDVTNLFLTRIAQRYSPITKSYVFAREPLECGNFYRDEELVKIFFWKNGALLIIDEKYELFMHKKDADKWVNND